jgi:hypothetical protein
VSAARRATTAVALLLLFLPALAGCEAAQQAQEGVGKAGDCAALVGELTGVDWSDVRGSAAQAEQAARGLDERLREVDDAEVKQAGEALRDRVQRLADAAGQADADDVRRAAADAEAAARRLAQACDVPVDQVGG